MWSVVYWWACNPVTVSLSGLAWEFSQSSHPPYRNSAMYVWSAKKLCPQKVYIRILDIQQNDRRYKKQLPSWIRIEDHLKSRSFTISLVRISLVQRYEVIKVFVTISLVQRYEVIKVCNSDIFVYLFENEQLLHKREIKLHIEKIIICLLKYWCLLHG